MTLCFAGANLDGKPEGSLLDPAVAKILEEIDASMDRIERTARTLWADHLADNAILLQVVAHAVENAKEPQKHLDAMRERARQTLANATAMGSVEEFEPIRSVALATQEAFFEQIAAALGLHVPS